MGYDMYTVEADTSRPDLPDVIDDATWEMMKHWHQDVEARDGYYRLNIWGMGNMHDLLYAAGCLNIVATYPWDGDVILTDEDTGGVLPMYKVSDNSGWLVSPAECIATALAWFEGGGRNKAHQQATAIAEEWSKDGDPVSTSNVLDWGEAFVRWIGGAASHGGFRVY